MAILFLVEIADGKVKKASFEAASYASNYANSVGKEAVGLTLGSIDDASLSALGIYGAKKIIVTPEQVKDITPVNYFIPVLVQYFQQFTFPKREFPFITIVL